MKHTLRITLFLLALFVLAQFLGLFLLQKEAKVTTITDINGTHTNVAFDDTSVGPRPETTGSGSLIYVSIAVFIGTILVLIIVRFGQVKIWKIWFLLAVWMALSVSIGAITKLHFFYDYDFAIVLGLIFALWKIFRPNIIVHNLTEVLMYSGIALILVPIFDLFWAGMLLIVFSLYDMYAVWKSEHMIKMAQFQTKSKMFAGIMINYTTDETSASKISTTSSNNTLSNNKVSDNKTSKLNSSKSKSSKITINGKPLKKVASSSKNAILGGGDIAFPLIFIGSFMISLIANGMSKSSAFLESSIIVVTTTIALGLLFLFAKKGEFYPAMPFISAGCLVGWLLTLLL